MTIGTAVPISTPMAIPTMDTIGNPAEVCPQTAAYYDRVLELYEDNTLESQIELSYIMLSVQRTREGLQEYRAYIDDNTVAPAPQGPSFDLPVSYLRPEEFRTCRQTRRSKSVNPQDKRELTKYEHNLLRDGILPGTVRDWRLITLHGKEYLWLAKALMAKRTERLHRQVFAYTLSPRELAADLETA